MSLLHEDEPERFPAALGPGRPLGIERLVDLPQRTESPLDQELPEMDVVALHVRFRIVASRIVAFRISVRTVVLATLPFDRGV